jgi:hypothetical protein
VRQVLEKLQEAGLQVDITEGQFHVQKVAILGMNVSTQGLEINPKKVATMKE